MDSKLIFADIKLTDNDPFFTGGDFAIAPSDEQHIVDIVQSFAGEWKQFPEVGVGVSAYMNSSGQQQKISRDVRVQLTADGYTVKSPDFSIDSKGLLIVAPHAVR